MKLLIATGRSLMAALVLCLPLAAQKVDVVSATLNGIDSGRAQVEIFLKNGTAHSVTAWSWLVKGTYPDGSTQVHEGTVDILGATDNQGPLEFRPGNSHQFSDSLPVVNGTAPSSVTATLTMVVFDDDTATGDRKMIQKFGALRKSMAEMEAEEFAEIQAALKAPSPKDALRTAMKSRQANEHGDGIMRQILVLLEHNASREDIDRSLVMLRQHQTLQAAHYNLVAVK